MARQPLRRGGRDSKAGQSLSPGEPSRTLVSEDGAFGLRAVPPDEPKCILVSRNCAIVPSEAILDGDVPATPTDGGDTVARALVRVQRDWEQSHDLRKLQRALLDLMRRLAGQE